MKVKAFPKIMGPRCDNILVMWGLLWLMGVGMVRSDDNLQEVMSIFDYFPCFKFGIPGKL